MTHTLLLWVLILTASVKLAVSHSPDLDGVEDYEVVRPIRLHTVRKRNAEHLRPETIKYAMTVGGEDIELHLERNSELLTKDYTETFYQTGGSPVTTAPQHIDHCYYHGRIVNDSESAASISTCDGLRGYFKTAAQKYLIEPLTADDQGDHAVIRYNETKFTPAVCGVTNTSWSDDFEPPTSRSRSRSAGPTIVQKQKYLELYLVADHREYIKMQRDHIALRKRMFEVVNFVNMVYKPLKTFIALVGLEIWSDGDLISVTPPAGSNLDAFMKWRNTNLLQRKKHDNAHLISGIDFEGATVGLAFIGTMCSGHSVGVVQDHTDRAIGVGATLAHEMGHNLGMSHDDSSSCACTGDSCIMAAALSWNIPKAFSSCSSNSYDNYLTSRTPGCLLNKPDYRQLVSESVCGNGFMEVGEECDCGTVEECKNPCCNATTCTLTEGSKCAAGECCDKCQILSRAHECRMKRDVCDLAEYCDGKSVNCPEDVFAVNGLPCDGGLGYCHNGQCPQRELQCYKMYGPTAEVGSLFCFNQNTRGLYYAFCKRPVKDRYIPCQEEDVMCGKLFCWRGNDNPSYGRMVTFAQCKAAFFDDETKDYGQVDTGTRCGDGMVCSQNECVDLETAYRATNCSAKCPGHGVRTPRNESILMQCNHLTGKFIRLKYSDLKKSLPCCVVQVCNHRTQCQCQPGWLPPNCDSKNESFGLSSGAIAAIAIALILVGLGVVAAVIGILWKKRQSPILPSTHTQRKQPPMAQSAYMHKRPVASQPTPVPQMARPKPKGAPPPPPPAGNRPKPPIQSYSAARQALRPVVPPRV